MTLNNTTLLTLGESDTTLALALFFGFMLMGIGFKRSEFLILAGPVWIISGLLIFIEYGVLFMFVGIGLGLVLFFEGVLGIANK
jgi:hypothetical protein